MNKTVWPVSLLLFVVMLDCAQAKPRARDLGIPFGGLPGPLNAITDVAGVAVGHTTLVSGEGALITGEGPVRTGVTAILPLGDKTLHTPVPAGAFSFNGNGEMTGMAWVEESGFLEGPVMITNTHSIGTVHQAVISWRVQQAGPDNTGFWWSLPVVAETWDGFLNDINGFHVKADHVYRALENAETGHVTEGNVGGGTGMVCYGFKGGIGTSSRKIQIEHIAYMVGVLVQANFGKRPQLMVAGVPVGFEMQEDISSIEAAGGPVGRTGSIIIVIATDAPLLPHQLKRLAKRASLGMARTGGISGNGSGDLFIAFSTTVPKASRMPSISSLQMLHNDSLNPIFEATVQATEEAIINALIAAESMTGRDDHHAAALPHDRLQQIMKKYNRSALNGQN